MNSIQSNDTNKTYKSWAILLCLLPILDPYVLFGELMIVEFIAISLVLGAILSNRITLNRTLIFLFLFFIVLALMSGILSSFWETDYFLQLKVVVFQIINIVAFGFLWRKSGKENFLNVVVVVGVVAASLAIVQFVAVTLGFTNFYDGRLPFQVGTNNHFGGLFDRNTGDVRVHSFFEEPSYLALFELPVLAFCIKIGKIKSAIIVGISCILTGSMLGVFGVIFVLLYIILMDVSIKKTTKIELLFGIAVMVILGISLYKSNITVHELFDYLINRMTTMENELDRTNSSVSLRLLGNIALFNEYPFINKVLGTGFNQYAVYFNLEKNYSNDFVTTLLDFGVLGIIALIIALFVICKKIDRDERVYFFIFVIALAIDHIWFNTYFFYLLTWCVVFMKKDDSIIIKVK